MSMKLGEREESLHVYETGEGLKESLYVYSVGRMGASLLPLAP